MDSRRVSNVFRRREEIWQRYNEAFANLPLTLPAAPELGTRHAYHLYTVLIDEARAGISRDAFLDAMTASGVGVGVHYLSIPEHPVYQQKFGWRPEDYPNATRIGRQTVSMPLSAKLRDEEVSQVIEAVEAVLSAESKGQGAKSKTASAKSKEQSAERHEPQGLALTL